MKLHGWSHFDLKTAFSYYKNDPSWIVTNNAPLFTKDIFCFHEKRANWCWHALSQIDQKRPTPPTLSSPLPSSSSCLVLMDTLRICRTDSTLFPFAAPPICIIHQIHALQCTGWSTIKFQKTSPTFLDFFAFTVLRTIPGIRPVKRINQNQLNCVIQFLVCRT